MGRAHARWYLVFVCNIANIRDVVDFGGVHPRRYLDHKRRAWCGLLGRTSRSVGEARERSILYVVNSTSSELPLMPAMRSAEKSEPSKLGIRKKDESQEEAVFIPWSVRSSRQIQSSRRRVWTEYK
jgi:hypothetical protein